MPAAQTEKTNKMILYIRAGTSMKIGASGRVGSDLFIIMHANRKNKEIKIRN